MINWRRPVSGRKRTDAQHTDALLAKSILRRPVSLLTNRHKFALAATSAASKAASACRRGNAHLRRDESREFSDTAALVFSTTPLFHLSKRHNDVLSDQLAPVFLLRNLCTWWLVAVCTCFSISVRNGLVEGIGDGRESHHSTIDSQQGGQADFYGFPQKPLRYPLQVWSIRGGK